MHVCLYALVFGELKRVITTGDAVWCSWCRWDGQDHADNSGIQPLREGADPEDAKVQMGILPRSEQRLHSLGDVRNRWKRRAYYSEPGKPFHCPWQHCCKRDHTQELCNRRSVEELAVAIRGRPFGEWCHLHHFRGTNQVEVQEGSDNEAKRWHSCAQAHKACWCPQLRGWLTLLGCRYTHT